MITMLRDAECVCHVGQCQQEGKWVKPLPSQKICCRPNTDVSFYLLLSPLAGTWVLLSYGQGPDLSHQVQAPEVLGRFCAWWDFAISFLA